MPFIQLDDQITEHPKILQAGAVSAWVWVSAIAYCQRQLTDGFVPAAAVSRLAQEATPKVLARLVSLKLLDRVDGGFLVHDYLQHNPSRVTVLRRRAEAAQRKERSRGARDGRVTGRVTPTVTDESSRVRIPTPTPTPTPTTDTESVSVDALAPPRLVSSSSHGVGPELLAAQELVQSWNRIRSTATGVVWAHISAKAQRDLAASLRTKGLDEWEATFRRAEASDYIAGRLEMPGASLWKVIELAERIDSGQYDNRKPAKVAGLTGGGVSAGRVSTGVHVIDPDYNGAPYRFHCAHTPPCTTWPQHRDAEAVAS